MQDATPHSAFTMGPGANHRLAYYWLPGLFLTRCSCRGIDAVPVFAAAADGAAGNLITSGGGGPAGRPALLHRNNSVRPCSHAALALRLGASGAFGGEHILARPTWLLSLNARDACMFCWPQ